MEIISRSRWGARPPRSVRTTTWDARTGVAVHYSDGGPDQTIRQIQDWCMDGRGFPDIDYNFLVTRDGRVWEGVGWTRVGTHIANANTPNIGVCFVGRNGDVTDSAKASIRWLYDEACRRAGRQLAMRYHSQLGNTDCPGDNLRHWVQAGMPVPGAHPFPIPRTWTEILMDNLPELSFGDGGRFVKRAQGLLLANGNNPGPLDSNFGDKTRAAVRAFQSKHALKVDGVCGPKTWTQLLTS